MYMRASTVAVGLLIVWSLAMVALAIWGGYSLYSPVPYFDSWDGIVHFLQQPHLNNLAVWVAQHNEHRIVLSRLLFWLDERYFGGVSIFLWFVNYLCAAGAACMFWLVVRRLSGKDYLDKAQVAVSLFIVAWLFQWMQVENFTWAFQSQFFLAQLLPLCALYVCYLSVVQPQQWWLFGMACALGVLSCGTMANGVLALPLMTVYVAYLNQSRWRVLTLAGLAIAMSLLYFHHFIRPIQHDTLGVVLRRDPVGLMQYVLMYLGNPFYYLVGQKKLGYVSAAVAGFVFIGLALRSAWWLWRQPVKQPLLIALFVYVLYIGATALATASGRELLGVTQALSSRYTTPMLMAWVALVLPYQPFLRRQSNTKHRGWWLLLLCLIVLMSRQQTKMLRVQSDTALQYNVAGLALELNVVDGEQLKTVYPCSPLHILPLAKQAFAEQRSFFNRYPFVGLRQSLTGSVPVSPRLPVCHIDNHQWQAIPDNSRFKRIEGELSGVQHADLVRFLDDKQHIIGYAMVSATRSQVLPWRYKGYVLNQSFTAMYAQVLHDNTVVCQAALSVP